MTSASLLSSLVTVSLTGGLVSQNLEWRIPSSPSVDSYRIMAPFADMDGDGMRDMLVGLQLDEGLVSSTAGHRIISGTTGETLWERRDPVAGRAVDAGDLDGDGVHDICMRHGWGWNGVTLGPAIQALSVGTKAVLWEIVGPSGVGYGSAMLGDIDVDGDDEPDFITITSDSSESDVYVHGNDGQVLYTIPVLAQGWLAISLGKMGDMDGDGCDDFLVGCLDPSASGVILLVSGQSGQIIRQSFGLLPGDMTAEFVSNVGDMDGDTVDDYAGFPWWGATRAIVTVFSGQTGAVIRTWDEFANSAITGEDIDLDGVPDLVVGADRLVVGAIGSTRAYSGRDGELLWVVDNFAPAPGSGVNNGTFGWMEYSAALGTPVAYHYPRIAWLDIDWFMTGTWSGRIRSWDPARQAQGPITGQPCSSGSQLPLIGARQTSTGARVTMAHGPSGGIAALNLGLANQTVYAGLQLPIDLGQFGLPGCSLYVAPQAGYLRVLGSTGLDIGYAQVNLPFQLTSATLGTAIAAQWIALDPANLGYAVTARHELVGQ